MNEMIPETVTDALAKWDAGESVWAISMGGLGPGYEQAIQILAFEIMREFVSDGVAEMPDDELDEKKDAMQSRIDAVVHRLDGACYGFSGAQVAAATNFAFCVLRRGYRTALEAEAVKDRHIQVSRAWPRAPEVVGTASGG